MHSGYYAPNFEENAEAYWFEPVRPSFCVLRLHSVKNLWRYGLEIWYVGWVWKLRRPVFFSLSIGFVIAELLPFSKFFSFLLQLVNKNISRTASARVMKFISQIVPKV